MGLQIAICDDDKVICRQLRQLLEVRDWSYQIDTYSAGEELLDTKKKYDIIFLDIEMKQINGLRTAKYLREKKRGDYIIFLTSHMEYMPDAFKVKAFRFLNKPIQIKQFDEAISEAEKEVFDNEKIVIACQGKRTNLVGYRDIVYVEALGDGTCVYTTDGEYITGKPLKYWQETLGEEHFFCIHKTYLVGMRHVKGIQNGECCIGEVELRLPIARRRRAEFQNFFLTYIKKNARSM